MRLAATLLLATAWPVLACPLPATALRQGDVQAAWTVIGAPIAVGRHFALALRVCPADATLLRVDATMPEHRHGMNYRPSLQALGDGRWRADGLMFHMAGRWELRLDLQRGGRTERLLDSITLP